MEPNASFLWELPEDFPAYVESDIDADRLLIASVPNEEALQWTVTVIYPDGSTEIVEPMIGFVGYNLHHHGDPANAVCWNADHPAPVVLDIKRPGYAPIPLTGARSFWYEGGR